ncbi:MAG: ubiquitin-conjugating enzyme E2, partial [Casimicrobiaceae bacterium]
CSSRARSSEARALGALATMTTATRREIDIERIRALASASGGRIGIVTLPVAGRPRFVLDLGYATAGSSVYPDMRQPSSRIAIDLAPRHPFQPPVTTVLTPIFHPHVFVSGVVCIGAKWAPGEGLDLFVKRVVQLLAYDPLLMNPHSIANAAANVWYRLALRSHPDAFPTDAAALGLTIDAPTADRRHAARGDAQAPAQRVIRHCPGCHAALRLPTGRSGTVRCPTCGRDFEAST